MKVRYKRPYQPFSLLRVYGARPKFAKIHHNKDDYNNKQFIKQKTVSKQCNDNISRLAKQAMVAVYALEKINERSKLVRRETQTTSKSKQKTIATN